MPLTSTQRSRRRRQRLAAATAGDAAANLTHRLDNIEKTLAQIIAQIAKQAEAGEMLAAAMDDALPDIVARLDSLEEVVTHLVEDVLGLTATHPNGDRPWH